MSESITPVDSIDQALVIAREAIRELKRPRLGESAAEARARSCETIKAQRRLIEASRRTVTDTVAAARKVGMKANGRANGKATPQITVTDAVEVCLQLAERALAEVRAAERRVTELEATQLTDGGTWKAEKIFKPGQLVTHDGVLWVCLEANSNVRPPSDCWRLMNKSHSRR